MERVDVGLFVVTGAADATQKRNLDDLRATCTKVFVILNKVDEWDDLDSSTLHEVVEQWKQALSIPQIYPTCAKGFDPRTRAGAPYDLRGVDELRDALETFLETKGKALLLARLMGEKRHAAQKIITTALFAVATEAFLPGSAAWITATQAAAIAALYCLYTGRVLDKGAALAILPVFAAESVVTTLFLWVKSFLPPTGILDVAAASVAVAVTLAILLAVVKVLATGRELHEKALLRETFGLLRAQTREGLANSSVSDWTSSAFWQKLLTGLMFL